MLFLEVVVACFGLWETMVGNQFIPRIRVSDMYLRGWNLDDHLFRLDYVLPESFTVLVSTPTSSGHAF